MMSVTFNTESTVRQLEYLAQNLPVLNRRVVLDTSKLWMVGILRRTPKRSEQPVPPNKYQRTNRLLYGWAPAADRLGVNMPEGPTADSGRDGDFQFIDNTNQTSFLSANNVRYAIQNEFIGSNIPSRAEGQTPRLMVTAGRQGAEEYFLSQYGFRFRALVNQAARIP